MVKVCVTTLGEIRAWYPGSLCGVPLGDVVLGEKLVEPRPTREMIAARPKASDYELRECIHVLLDAWNASPSNDVGLSLAAGAALTLIRQGVGIGDPHPLEEGDKACV